MSWVVLRRVGTLAFLAACNAQEAPPLPLPPVQQAAERDFLELRTNEPPFLRYLRIEANGEVEYARHSWYTIQTFRKGRIEPGEAEALLARAVEAGVLELPARVPRTQDGGPETDPVAAEMVLRRGPRRHTVSYDPRRAAPGIQELHSFLITRGHDFPPNPTPGDYLRVYEWSPREGALREDIEIRRLPAAELARHPAVAACVANPGRLVRGAEPGQAQEREWVNVDPPGFFFESEGRIFRVLFLEYRP